MKIYNTLTRKKEEFVPIEEGKVKMYVCGPTVYNYFHIGNARPFVVFDTLRKYLEYRGYKVKFVQNFTDVDDKIIKRAKEEGVTAPEISEKYIEEYYKDAAALNVKKATVHPKVSETMNDIIQFVQDLIDKGAVLISQHSDSTTPATTAQKNGVYHVGYNLDMSDVAQDASIVSSRIDWTNYMVYVIETIVNGGKVDQDYKQHGYADGDVKLTDLNENVAAAGTADKLAEVEAALADGSLQVFDTSKFTVGGKELKSAFALDTDGDFTPDKEEAVFDGAFHESYFQSAPYFAQRIDGITLLNEEY